MGSPRPSTNIFLKQPHGSLAQLRTLAWSLFRGKRAALVEPLEVAVDRGAADPEPMGGLTFGDAPSDGLHYLGTQVYRIGFHDHRMEVAQLHRKLL